MEKEVRVFSGLSSAQRIFGDRPMHTDVTQMLVQWSEGDHEAFERLLPLLYDELKRLAGARMRGERDDHTLNTTALVHEAYLKLIDVDRVQWRDRAHFLAMASRQMRRILIDYAHRRNAGKRGAGAEHIALDEASEPFAGARS